MEPNLSKTPRLYIERNLSPGAMIALEEDAAHYLRNVLRMRPGDALRVFNGSDGEWLAAISEMNKKDGWLTLREQIKPQPGETRPIHLFFAPIKKDAMDFLIEKAVELGVTDLHPVLTNRTEIRKINEERLQAQITEAAEQCERLDLAVLHPLTDLKTAILEWEADEPILWCRERGNSTPLPSLGAEARVFLIGPEGGFDDQEIAFLESRDTVKPVSLGDNILRAETAALLVIGYAKLSAA